LSAVLGWIYFTAWSLSFYPQIILNFNRKSVSGLSVDFVYLNFIGFLCYTIYNLYFYYSDLARNQYLQRWGSENVIQINDLFFSIHALTLCFIAIVQTWTYKATISEPLSRWARLYIAGSGVGVTIFSVLVSRGDVLLLDLLYFLSLVKMGVSLLKYTPQVILNHRKKSTVGWSIENILLDLTGGLFSLGQLIVDASILNNWTAITGNPVKFGLSMTSIVYDAIFIVQHYILYPNQD
ncbi:PQ loop repeat-domain-containing protein, partial [Globomyces pollinis-pini]